LAALYTTVPYTWRRHLSLTRAVLASAGFVLYVAEPLQYRLLALCAIGVYAAFGFFILVRSGGESPVRSLSLLAADTVFLCICALHPHRAATWLTTMVYFHVLLLGTLLHTWRYVALLATIVAVVICATKGDLLCPAVIVGGVLAVLFALYKDQMQERLSAALRRSVLSRSEAEIAREQERQRIAGDFHDGPLQAFISFQMRLEIIRRLLARDGDAAMRELVQLQDLGRAQVTELRAFVRGMQPTEITSHNLGGAIRESVEHFERDSGIAAQLSCGDLSGVDNEVAIELLQMVREALNNVRKHSKASRVSIVIEAGDRGVEMTVEDDGSGFAFSGTYTLDELEILRLGPRSIKRRVRTLNGEMTLDSRPSAGVTLRIRIPAER
jgi:signal transduction histidine kinase